MVSCRQKQNAIARMLTNAGIEDAAYEAKLLLQTVTGLDAAALLLDPIFPADAEADLAALVQKRITGIPLQYLLGEWEFYGLDFAVGEGVLIPRQDTEVLVSVALSHLSRCTDPIYLDLCSGTGCIPLAIGSRLCSKKAYAVEYSDAAYRYLTENIALHHADWLTPLLADALAQDTLSQFTDESLDCITANPPYLNEADMASLQKEVRFEPEDALYAPENGLFFYRMLSKLWKTKLKIGGMLCFEVGVGQADAVKALLAENGYDGIGTEKDLNGIDRVVFCCR